MERCSFVLKKKNRKCRMLVKYGQKYCGEHATYDELNEVSNINFINETIVKFFVIFHYFFTLHFRILFMHYQTTLTKN